MLGNAVRVLQGCEIHAVLPDVRSALQLVFCGFCSPLVPPQPFVHMHICGLTLACAVRTQICKVLQCMLDQQCGASASGAAGFWGYLMDVGRGAMCGGACTLECGGRKGVDVRSLGTDGTDGDLGQGTLSCFSWNSFGSWFCERGSSGCQMISTHFSNRLCRLLDGDSGEDGQGLCGSDSG